jgi:hypothetical protein
MKDLSLIVNRDALASRPLSIRLYPLSVVLCFMLSAGILWAKPSAKGFDQPGEVVRDQHLIPHVSDAGSYGEKYTFDADFGDRGRFYFSMQISNIGVGDEKMTARGSVTIDGEKIRWSFKRDEGKWKYNKKKLDIRGGSAKLSGTVQALRFQSRSKSKKAEIDFVFTPIAQPWRPPQGGLRFGASHRTEYNLFPLSSVKGVVRFKDRPDVELSGLGWGTHTWSHLGPHEQSTSATQFRGLDLPNQKTLYMREIQVGGDYAPQSLSYVLMTSGAQLLFQGFGFKKTVKKSFTDKKHPNRYKVAEDFSITARDIKHPDVTLEATFSAKKRTHHRNPISSYSWILRKLIEQASKPMEYAYQMNFKAQVSGGSNGAAVIEGTSGKYEINHFNK